LDDEKINAANTSKSAETNQDYVAKTKQ